MAARVLDTHAVLHVYNFLISSPLARVGHSLRRPQLPFRSMRRLESHSLGYIRPPDAAHDLYHTPETGFVGWVVLP